MRDKLIELIDEYTDPLSARDIHNADFAEKFADHLLDEGVIVPKAKIGDTIYILEGGRVREEEVKKICIHSNGLTYAFNWHGMGYEWVSDTDFGKTVFLTREEAERALKGADDGKAD